MSVTPNNVVVYGSANMPEADGVTVGGAVDFTKRVAFYDISPAGTMDWVSSSASDTAVKAQVTGRDSTGVIQTPAAVTLNGQTVVTGSQTFERIGAAVITGGAIAGLTNPGGTRGRRCRLHGPYLRVAGELGHDRHDLSHGTNRLGQYQRHHPAIVQIAVRRRRQRVARHADLDARRHRPQPAAHDYCHLGLWHRHRCDQSRLGNGARQHDYL